MRFYKNDMIKAKKKGTNKDNLLQKPTNWDNGSSFTSLLAQINIQSNFKSSHGNTSNSTTMKTRPFQLKI